MKRLLSARQRRLRAERHTRQKAKLIVNGFQLEPRPMTNFPLDIEDVFQTRNKDIFSKGLNMSKAAEIVEAQPRVEVENAADDSTVSLHDNTNLNVSPSELS